MVFILTTDGYINVENPAIKLHKFKAISGFEKPNPHISIDLKNINNYFEITFMNSMDILLHDELEILNDEGEYVSIDKLKFGAKLAIVRTPDHVVERLVKKPEYIELINDLAKLIVSNGKLKKIDYDATHCDMIIDWSKERIESFIFSLSSVGLYIKVKVGKNNDNRNILIADSNALNYLDENKDIICKDVVKELEDMGAISIINIDKQRDSDEYKIVKSVKKINNSKMFLKTTSGVDSWEYITICGIQCRAKNVLES